MSQLPELPELPPQPFSADCDEYYGQAPPEGAWYWPSIEKMLTAYGLACYQAGMERAAVICLDYSEDRTTNWQPHRHDIEKALGAEDCAAVIRAEKGGAKYVLDVPSMKNDTQTQRDRPRLTEPEFDYLMDLVVRGLMSEFSDASVDGLLIREPQARSIAVRMLRPVAPK